MQTYIIYSGDGEVLVTTPALEQLFLTEWFSEGGRCLTEYDRTETDQYAVRVRVSGMIVD